MKTNSIAFRLVAGAALWIGAALAVSGYLLAALFDDHVERGFDRRMGVVLESLIAVTEIDGDGKLLLRRAPGEPRFERPFSGWYWQIKSGAEGHVSLRSKSLWDQSLEITGADNEAVLQSHEIPGPRDQELRVVTRNIMLPDAERRFQFAVAADLAELDTETRPFNLLLGFSLAGLWLGLMIAVALQVIFGLRPLDRLRAGLVDIRTGRAERLEGDFATEVAPLAHELNALLEQIGRVVEHARTHVGNLAHALKTPLSVISNEAGREETPLAETVRSQTAVMTRQVDHHLARARAAATANVIGARCEVSPVVEDLRRTLARIHAARDISIAVGGIKGAVFRGDRQDLEEMIGNVLDNACKWANSAVRIDIGRDGRNLCIAVEDDGDGLPEDQRREALRRGARLDETVPGSGFGLAIVQEIAGLYDGSLELSVAALGGLRVDLVIPEAES
ncbi:MAG: sensor histidine kinase [Pseudomonadota bacterium]|nr:sensor histidine kinase [Pseudomonadota bacterium]MEE2969103.1 sensor histidine kinase [Pseudomonadota bacterium]